VHIFGSQTICNNNRTQRQMEKSQQELKRTRLRNRRFKNLAEIAVVYHDISKSLLLEYEDGFRKKAKKTQHVSNKNAFEIRRKYICCLATVDILHFQKKKEVECSDIAEEQWAKRRRKGDGLNKNIGVYLQPPSKSLLYSNQNRKYKAKLLWIFEKEYYSLKLTN